MTSLIRISSLVIASLLIPFVIAEAHDWKIQKQKDGITKISVVAHGMTPAGLTPTTLTLQCRPGSDGAITIIYLISGVDTIKEFPWNDFEGPDAPNATKKLGRMQVISVSGTVTFQTALSGFFANPEAFAFSVSAPSGTKSEVREIIEKLINGAGTFSFCVQSADASGKICTDFPARKAGESVEQAMKPCL